MGLGRLARDRAPNISNSLAQGERPTRSFGRVRGCFRAGVHAPDFIGGPVRASESSIMEGVAQFHCAPASFNRILPGINGWRMVGLAVVGVHAGDVHGHAAMAANVNGFLRFERHAALRTALSNLRVILGAVMRRLAARMHRREPEAERTDVNRLAGSHHAAAMRARRSGFRVGPVTAMRVPAAEVEHHAAGTAEVGGFFGVNRATTLRAVCAI